MPSDDALRPLGMPHVRKTSDCCTMLPHLQSGIQVSCAPESPLYCNFQMRDWRRIMVAMSIAILCRVHAHAAPIRPRISPRIFRCSTFSVQFLQPHISLTLQLHLVLKWEGWLWLKGKRLSAECNRMAYLRALLRDMLMNALQKSPG
jgi:hypothetical protein